VFTLKGVIEEEGKLTALREVYAARQ